MADILGDALGGNSNDLLSQALQGKKPAGNVSPPATPSGTNSPGSASSQEPGASSDESTVSRYGNLIGEHLARGLISAAGMPRSLTEWESSKAHEYLPPGVAQFADRFLGKPPQEGQPKEVGAPDVSEVQSWLDRKEAEHGLTVSPPRTPGERLAAAGAEGFGMGILGGLPGAASGALSGGASELAHQEFPNSTAAPIAAGLAAGLVPLGGLESVANTVKNTVGGRAGAALAGKAEGLNNTIREIVAPETIDASSRAAATQIRQGLGQAARDTEMSTAALDPFRKHIMALDPADKANFIQYMETRSTANAPKIASDLQAPADEVRKAYQLRATKLSNLPEYQKMQFIDDYYKHLWKDPNAAQQFTSRFGGKEGSSTGSLKERSIPTIADGIAAGLVPVSEDPIETTLNYVASMDRFIATKQIQEAGKQAGMVKVVQAGQKPPQGWTEVDTHVGKRGLGSSVWAEPGWARVYNNLISRGAFGNETAGKVYKAAQATNAAMNQAKLGISLYHASTMSGEAIMSDVARGIGEAFNLSPGKALKAIAGSPLAPARSWMKGRQVIREYLHPGTSDPLMKKITDLGTEANMNVGRLTNEIRTGGAGSFFKALKRGTLKMELAADARTMKGAPITGTAKVFFKNMGRAFDSLSQPIFEKLIPQLKAGAFYSNMRDWLAANPEASAEVQTRMAQKIWDSIDNRFGEMNHDNIFWNNMLKQGAMLGLRSYSWKLGTSRELLGGGADILRNPRSISMGSGEMYSPRAGYVFALPMVYAAAMGAYQYMKTGEAPKDLHDLVAGRTGGTNYNVPARAELPSYMKDVLTTAQSPKQEITGSESPLLQLGQDMWTGNDWKGQPIADPNASAPAWAWQWMKHIGEQFVPISIETGAQGAPKGSNLSSLEQALGIRLANHYVTDPAGYERKMKGIYGSDWRKKVRTDNKQKARYGGID